MIYVNDFCINCEAIQSLLVEKQLNRPPDGDLEACANYFRSIISSNSIRNKCMILAGGFNVNVLDFEQNKEIQNFVNLMFQFGLVPTINKKV